MPTPPPGTMDDNFLGGALGLQKYFPRGKFLRGFEKNGIFLMGGGGRGYV